MGVRASPPLPPCMPAMAGYDYGQRSYRNRNFQSAWEDTQPYGNPAHYAPQASVNWAPRSTQSYDQPRSKPSYSQSAARSKPSYSQSAAPRGIPARKEVPSHLDGFYPRVRDPQRSPRGLSMGGLDDLNLGEESLAHTVLGGSASSHDDTMWAKPFDRSDALGEPLANAMEKPKAPVIQTRARAMSVPQKCAVCLESLSGLDSGKLKECEHMFCFDCIQQWANVTNKCPLCKVVFSEILREDGSSNEVEDRVQVNTASGVVSYTLQETTDIGNALDRSLQALMMDFDSRNS